MFTQLIEQLKRFQEWMWSDRPQSESFFGRLGVFLLRLVTVVVRDIAQGELTLRAMSLVYTTLLSFVPLLAVSFSVLKGFGVHNFLEDFLSSFLSPLGPKGVELTANILGFIENMKVGVLGAVGVAFLLYTVVSLIQKIEASCNFIWRIKTARSLGQRFSDYLSVVFVGPVLIFLAMGTTASISSNTIVVKLAAIEPFGSLILLWGKILPYLFVTVAFTFIYSFLPNTKVRLTSAFIGGIVAGTLWQSVGLFFASFVESSTNFSAIYSSFAILIVFLIWLYIGWFILLLGCSVAYYHQNPTSMRLPRKPISLSGRQREQLGMSVMVLIARRFARGEPPVSSVEIAQRLNVPEEVSAGIVENLINGHLITATANEPPTYLPVRAIGQMKLTDVLDVLRDAGRSRYLVSDDSVDPAVAELFKDIESNVGATWSEATLKDYVSTPE